MVVEGHAGAFHPTPITAGYTACSMNHTLNLGRYVVSFEAVPLQNKTSNLEGCTTCLNLYLKERVYGSWNVVLIDLFIT